MRARIEHADPLTLLRELPARWAQTCIARPSPNTSTGRALEILTETRRVLRDDGTLWLLAPPTAHQQLAELTARGYQQQPTPIWVAQLAAHRHRAPGLLLFTKHARYFHQQQTIGHHCRRPLITDSQRACRQCRTPRGCPVALAHELELRVIKQCVLAGSSRHACTQCGAPYHRAPRSEVANGPGEPTCPHNSPGGRCLVIDPFYEPALPTAEAALCAGRTFLGIADAEPTR